MLRVDFQRDDFARVRFLPRPAPLVELKVSLMMARRTDSEVCFGRWRRAVRRRLPPTARPLWDLVQPFRGPAFLDPVSGSLDEGLEIVRRASRRTVRADVARLGRTPTPWVRALMDADTAARDQLTRALQDAHDTVLAPTWPGVRERHAAEFARYALDLAEHGVAPALTGLCPGSSLRDGVWEIPGGADREVRLHGRDLTLLPTFHWTGAPLVANAPGRPLLLVYAAGPGAPVPDTRPEGDPLADVLGGTRARTLRLLADPLNTSDLASRLGVSAGSASGHASALRHAGLITTTRDGLAVQHAWTALGRMLAEAGGPGPGL